MVNLSELELSKGKPVPDLQEYLSSNAFLSSLIETVPHYIKSKLFKELLNLGIDDIDTIKGQQYLPTIIHLIKQKFMTLELMIKSSPNLLPLPTPTLSLPRRPTNLPLRHILHKPVPCITVSLYPPLY